MLVRDKPDLMIFYVLDLCIYIIYYEQKVVQYFYKDTLDTFYRQFNIPQQISNKILIYEIVKFSVSKDKIHYYCALPIATYNVYELF